LPCNHLRLPFGVERDAENGFALVAQELQSWQRSLRTLIASSERFDEQVWSGFALWTLTNHGWLRFGVLEQEIKSVAQSYSPHARKMATPTGAAIDKALTCPR